MGEVTGSSGTGAFGMSPSPAATPTKRSVFLEDEKDGTPALAEAGDIPTLTVETAAIDATTAAAVEETRQEFFSVQDAGAANRIEQGQLLLKAQAQLARYGTGTFNAMLVAPRPDGFAFKSPTSGYDLMAEAEGKPKRSHKAKRSTNVTTPGRLNEPQLPMNLDGAASPSAPTVEVPDKLPATLDTSHTHTYVAFRSKGVYIPKADVEGFTQWLQSFSNAALSDQFLAWYYEANPSNREESNETATSIQ